MPTSRRRLILAGLAIPGLLAARAAERALGDALRTAARGARPAPDGTSATRCAQCGAPGHTMLDARCPLAPRVLA